MGGMHATDPAPPTLLLVEDDPIVRAFLADNLTADGYAVLVADTLADGLRALEYRKPDAAIVDVGLPDGSGLDLVTRVRAAGRVATRLDPGLPLVVLSGRAGELDRIRSFDKGADDFVSKPFSYGELRRRVEALLRRAGERRSSGLLRVGALEVDPVGREVRLDGERVVVSAEGVRAAARARRRALARLHEGRVAPRRVGVPRDGHDAHAGQPRVPAAAQARAAPFVVNVWGVGYRLVDGPVRELAA